MRLRNLLPLIFLLPAAGLFGQAQAFEFDGVVIANGKTTVCLTELTSGNYEARWLPAPGGVWGNWKVGPYTPATPKTFKVSTTVDEAKSSATVVITDTKGGTRRQVLPLKDALVAQTGAQPVRRFVNNPNNVPPDPPQTIIVNGKAVTVQPGESVEKAIDKTFGVKPNPASALSAPASPAPNPNAPIPLD